jgi:hypothetical protein
VATDAQTWRCAWQRALYGPGGFYRMQSPAAHFATSAQGIPGGTAVLAQAVRSLARRYGCDRVVDLGCGRGELLAELRVLDPGLHLTGVDLAPQPPHPHLDRWLSAPGGAALPAALTGLTDTLVLAHEWLDVVPCPVVARDPSGTWREVTVDTRGLEGGGLAAVPLTGAHLDWADRWLGPQLRRAEVGLDRDLAWADLVARVDSGVVLAVDYGHTAADRPRDGTLTGFRRGRQVPPVPDGSVDVTAHVAVDSLVAVAETLPGTWCQADRQRAVLVDLLGDPAVPVPHALASREPAAYLRALARRSALATLTAPGGLGDFWWVLAGRGA